MDIIKKLAFECSKLAKRHKGINTFIKTVTGPQIICNINYFSEKQKRALLCYLPQCFEPNENHIGHANVLHARVIVTSLIKKNLCIDVCYSNDVKAYDILHNTKYDYIIGFGKTYDKFLADNSDNRTQFITLVTENDPNIVAKRYKERTQYFEERHPSWSIKNFIVRDSFYNPETFNNIETSIVMSSKYNIDKFLHKANRIFPINVNGLYNSDFSIEDKLGNFNPTRFIWFGSAGLLHKGLDILIDAFAKMPNLHLEVYGAVPNELKAIKKIPTNVEIKGRINVLSHDFLKVVYSNSYVLSMSCSEGMNTGIATCMLHGMVPVITKETGFDSYDTIFEFPGYKIEDAVAMLENMAQIDEPTYKGLSRKTYEYAHRNFTLEAFSDSFSKIINEIM